MLSVWVFTKDAISAVCDWMARAMSLKGSGGSAAPALRSSTPKMPGLPIRTGAGKSFSLCSGRFRWTWGSPKQGGQCVRPKKNVVHGMVNPFGSKRNSKNTKIQITAQMCQWTDNRCKAVCLPTKKEISMKASIYNWISRRWCKEGHSTGFGLFGVA